MSAFGRLTYHIIEGLKADVQMSTYNHHWRSDSFEKANEFSGLRTTTAQFGELNRNKLEHITRQSKIILSLLWLVTPIRKIKINQWKQLLQVPVPTKFRH